MFDTLIESAARPARRTGGTTVSMLVHGTIVGLGIIVATPAPRAAPVVRHPITKVIYLVPQRVQPTPGTARPAGEAIRPPSPTEFLQPAPPVGTVPPIALPEPGQPLAPIGPVLPAGSANAPPGVPAAPAGGGIGGGDEPRDEFAVEHAPRLLAGAPVPSYPVALRRAGIEGRVLAQFVVDTLGRVELENVELLEAAHPMFAGAVREALARYRFTPGESGGRRVRTRVQVPFDFRLSR